MSPCGVFVSAAFSSWCAAVQHLGIDPEARGFLQQADTLGGVLIPLPPALAGFQRAQALKFTMGCHAIVAFAPGAAQKSVSAFSSLSSLTQVLR